MTVKVVRLKITASEWEVMDAVWKLGEASSRQIIEAMKGHRPRWNAKTIRTFINRLVEKQVVRGIFSGQKMRMTKRPSERKRK